MSERWCLQCGETKSSIRAQGIVLCGIVEGYETPELAYEFPHHRWADWKDGELARFGVRPEAFDKHRRTQERDFEWISCEDTVRGHHAATSEDVPDWASRVGECALCGHVPQQPASGSSTGGKERG